MEITKAQAELILQILPTVTLAVNATAWKNFAQEAANGSAKAQELQDFEDALKAFVSPVEGESVS